MYIRRLLPLCILGLLTLAPLAQAAINSGSNGSDGALNPAANLVIDMADHPDGIYHYTSVNIPAGVTVSFTNNTFNAPVTWLIQDTCTIAGTVSVRGFNIGEIRPGTLGAPGGPGGFAGGSGIVDTETQTYGAGQGPGGGKVIPNNDGLLGGSGSFGTKGSETPSRTSQFPSGDIYGSQYLLPLLGGSGGGGGKNSWTNTKNGGGGGGGAMLIAAGTKIVLSGSINANGGGGSSSFSGGGGGSGGAVRLVSQLVQGNGSISASGGQAWYYWSGGNYQSTAGQGRARVDAIEDAFTGNVSGVLSRGYQPVIIMPQAQQVSLRIKSVGTMQIPEAASGQIKTPDVVIPSNLQNPVTVVVECRNISLNTEIVLEAKPTSGAPVIGAGFNTQGTPELSTATLQIQLPRGGGTIQARAISGLILSSSNFGSGGIPSLSSTGWTADGESFASVEVMAGLDGMSHLRYITPSGKSYKISGL